MMRGDIMHYHEFITDRGYKGFNPCEYGFEDCRPSHHFGPVIRPNWLFHYIVSGFGIFQINGKTYNLGPGQMFIIPPGVTTYYEADRIKPWIYTWIGFVAENELPVCLPDVVTEPEIGEIFESMKQCSKMENGKEAFLSGKIWELFGKLLEQTKPTDDLVDISINYMKNNYHNKISIADIADKIGFDRSYFSTAFKKKNGISPQHYLMKLRMEKAASLMIKSGVKPSVAAVSVGYDDLFVFSKAFKKHFGLSPRDYIAKMNNEN